MGKEYSRLIFIYDWGTTVYIMLLVLIFVMVIGGIVKNRKIIHKKEVVLLVLATVLLDGTCGFIILNVMGIIHTKFWVFLAFGFFGLGTICFGYLLKYQEEVAKMGRKKIFISTVSSKEVFVMAGLIISLGVCLAIVIHL